MEREDILRVLRAHPDNCIRAFHRGHPHSTGRTEGRVLIRHYGGLIPDEIPLRHVMFLKVQGDLCITNTWGTALLGGCTWRLREQPATAPSEDTFAGGEGPASARAMDNRQP